MSGMDLVVQWRDMMKLRQALDKVAKVPQKVVTKAASRGASISRRQIKGKVPIDTGALKRGIKQKAEKSRLKGKKVYSIYVDVEAGQRVVYNPVHTTTHRNVGGGKEYYAFYPASQEYGFLTRSKGGGLSYVPGYRYMKKGAEGSEHTAKQTMIRTATTELEKEWVK